MDKLFEQKTMQALVLNGIEEALQMKTVPIPVIKPGTALVQVRAAALNRRDWWIQQGKYAGLKFPIVLGSDGAGLVVAVNGNLSDEAWIGKSVLINPSLDWELDADVQPAGFSILGLPEDGTFAEYVAVPIRNLYELPEYLSYEEAAALPLAGLTAYRALFRKARVKAGENVLISGVGGGVGAFALQWAMHSGANVYVTSGHREKLDIAIAAGAMGGFNYKDADWAKQLKEQSGGIDVVIDGALGDGFSHFLELANPGGRIVFYGGTAGNIPPLDGRKIFWKQLQILGTTMGSAVDFQHMLDFATQHRIKPMIDRVLDWKDAQQGMDQMSLSTQFGKLVLQINPLL